MLVLSRRVSESIHIGDDVVLVVTRVGRNRVHLGIQAPPDTQIRRGELEAHPSQVQSSHSARMFLSSQAQTHAILGTIGNDRFPATTSAG